MSIEFVIRLLGMVIFTLVSVQSVALFRPEDPQLSTRLIIVVTLAGSALGLLITPYLTIRPFNWARASLRRVPAPKLLAGVIGMSVGLAIAALLYPPLSTLPTPYGYLMPVVVSIIFGYVGLSVMVMRQTDIFSTIDARLPGTNPLGRFGSRRSGDDVVLLDTSVIIDGRIADISQTGFIRSTMLVPRFILVELQHIADSPDALRRNRGRRGLELLRRLQKDSRTPVQITDLDAEGVKGADDKLVVLAKQLNCPIMTNDFNLNNVAKLQGVVVLNINELANAVKTVILPGESMTVKIIQEGKERNQGVGYLSDGTMVVVEEGKFSLNRTVNTLVTKVLQTSAGRMIFAKLDNNG